MQLLSPEKIRDEKKTGAEEARVRTGSLAKEENDLVFRINLLRQDEEDYLKRKQERDEKDQPGLIIKKTVLEQEVDALEARKKAALEPIFSLEREADALMANAKQAVLSNEEWGAALKTQKDALVARETAVKQAEDDNKAATTDIVARETAIAPKEAEIRRQTEDLASKVADHSVKVANDDEAMAKRESKMQQDIRIVEIETQRQKERDHEQNERERGLQVRYAALEKAEGLKKL